MINTFSFTRKINKLFRRKQIIFSDPLLWVENGLLQYDEYIGKGIVKTTIKSMEKILEDNNIFDDKLFLRLYNIYIKDYYIYDHYPYLLTIEMIKLVTREFRLHISDDIYFERLKPTPELYDGIPSIFKLPEILESDLLTLLERVRVYLDKPISNEYYNTLIRIEYLTFWKDIYKSTKSNTEAISNTMRSFVDIQMGFLVLLASNDNKTMVNNIIERFWTSKRPNDTIDN